MPSDQDVPEIEPEELAERLQQADAPQLIDVREQWEHRLASIPGARLVPLNTVPNALNDLDPAAEYVIMCHHGMRSLMAARFLRQHGFQRVANLRGGIAAWSDEIDPSVPQY